MALPTRGRFVCHVHSLVHDGAVRLSPCGPHHEDFGRNLYHMFVPAYSASQILCFVLFVVFELLRSQMLNPCLFPKRCSHIAMWILILLDHRGRHVNSFPTGVLLFKWIWSFSPSARSFPSFLNGVCFIRPKLSLFFPPHPPPPLFFEDSDFLIGYPFYWWEVSPCFSVNVFILWFSGRC